MTTLFIEYNQTQYGDGTTYRRFLRNRENVKKTWQSESIEVLDELAKLDTLHLVSVIYTSGSTFGEDSWHTKQIGVYATYQEAANVEREIEEDDKLFREESSYSFKGKRRPVESYKAWQGYFERLVEVRITTLPVIE